MARIKLVVQYNGKNFSGWQLQPNKRTVQGELEKVLEFLLKENIRTYASGRTDTGVSSYGQVVHFDCNQSINTKKFLDSLNWLTPEDIAVTSCEIVPETFDARFSAKKKTYQYRFYVSKYTLPLFEDTCLRINDYVDIKKMDEASKYFIGTHDFGSFVAKKSGKTDFVRTIYDSKIIAKDDGSYAYEVTGNGFLYNMVRIMFGTILKVGYGKMEPKAIVDILEKKNRIYSGKTMPAKALYMKSVEYDK